MDQINISKASLSRLPAYYRYVKNLPKDVRHISATAISKALNLGEVQVRKDLQFLCGSGRPRTGYLRSELEEELRSYFCKKRCGTIVVGAGPLGMALLSYEGFTEFGIEVLAVFDENPPKICEDNNGKVYSTSSLKAFCKKNNVKIAIITAPAYTAQTAFEKVYECGIKCIMCFSPIKLNVPEDVTVRYENMIVSLAYLKKCADDE